MADNKKSLKNPKPKTIEFKCEVIGGKISEEQYIALMPFILEAIAQMYEEDKNKHDK